MPIIAVDAQPNFSFLCKQLTMPIPPFDSISSVLPPHLGNPALGTHHSPYECTVLELCQRFAVSPRRLEILHGYLALREQLFSLSISGFQWLDGSFVEDVETHSGRPPGDIDVVTFTSNPSTKTEMNTLLAANRWLIDRAGIKATHHVDHFIVPLGIDPRLLINLSRYWYGLFSHRRDSTWKGMLSVELSDPAEDAAAKAFLGNLP